MSPVAYNSDRDITPRFVNIVARWIRASSELLVVLRYVGSGAKDYALIRDELEFRRLMDVCESGTEFIVFRDPQLPFRGVVTEEFIAESRELIPDGSEYLCISVVPESSNDPRLPGSLGDTHANLTEDLRDFSGSSVAVGPCPPFVADDNETMVSASKGGLDGPR